MNWALEPNGNRKLAAGTDQSGLPQSAEEQEPKRQLRNGHETA